MQGKMKTRGNQTELRLANFEGLYISLIAYQVHVKLIDLRKLLVFC